MRSKKTDTKYYNSLNNLTKHTTPLLRQTTSDQKNRDPGCGKKQIVGLDRGLIEKLAINREPRKQQLELRIVGTAPAILLVSTDNNVEIF